MRKLSALQLQVTEVIYADGRSWVYDMARRLGVDRHTVHTTVRRLRDLGYVESPGLSRGESTRGRERRLWQLTAAGLDAYRETKAMRPLEWTG